MSAPFIPALNCTKTALHFSRNGQQVINTIWVDWGHAATEQNRSDLNDAILDWWSGTAATNADSSIQLDSVETVNQESQNAPSTTTYPETPVNGSVAGGGAPNNVAQVVSLRTGLRGRSYRGRMYWAGIPKSKQATETTCDATWLTALAGDIQALLSVINALSAIWVVVSHWTAGAARASAVKTPVTGLVIDNQFDSQRRRLAGRGV